jgi:hypothetical protein
VIVEQPYLKCCANCTHGWEGYDGAFFCFLNRHKYGDEVATKETNICEEFELMEGVVR